MTEIFLVRHAQTQWNVERRMQGKCESELTSLGIEQSFLLSLKLSKVNFSAIYSSPSIRSYKTAKILIEHREKDIFQSDLLREIDFGSWEGRTINDIQVNDTELFFIYKNMPSAFRAPGGETFGEVQERAFKFIDSISEKHFGQKILTVTHGGLIRTVLTKLKGFSLDEVWNIEALENTSITLIRADNSSVELVYENRKDHLESVEKE